MSRGKRIANRIIVLAAVLLGLTLLSSRGIGSIYAKYTTGASWSDGARVARFAIHAAPGANQGTDLGTLKKGESATYTFTVTNQVDGKVNETATDYDVVVKLPQKADGLTLSLTNGSTPVAGTTADDTTWRFANAGTFAAAAEKTDTLTLTFAVGDGAKNAKLQGISVTVEAAQKQ